MMGIKISKVITAILFLVGLFCYYEGLVHLDFNIGGLGVMLMFSPAYYLIYKIYKQ